jgi:hypothetical protein
MKLDPDIHIVMHSVFSLKPGVTAYDLAGLGKRLLVPSRGSPPVRHRLRRKQPFTAKSSSFDPSMVDGLQYKNRDCRRRGLSYLSFSLSLSQSLSPLYLFLLERFGGGEGEGAMVIRK